MKGKSFRTGYIDAFLCKIRPFQEKIKTVYLFGSRCRSDWRPDSDYDILLVVEKKDRGMVSDLYDVVMDILLASGKLISLKIFPESEFERLKAISTPFVTSVVKEGIALGFGG